MEVINTSGRPASQDREAGLLICGNKSGADDGNRTRVLSLGTSVITLESGPDLRTSMCAGCRCWPWLTALNGPLMARSRRLLLHLVLSVRPSRSSQRPP